MSSPLIHSRKLQQLSKAGKFKDEIVPVEVKLKKKTVVVDTDEGPRPGTTAESISKLRPAFKKDGIVTAANSSGINDGAACVVVMSEEKAKRIRCNSNGYMDSRSIRRS